MSSVPPSTGPGPVRIPRPTPLRESAYEALLELIVRRELEPGRHLVESELAQLLGVSRQPVREALQRLNTEGWVDLRPGFGAFVHQPTADEAEQLFHVRGLLETESARLAAEHHTQEGLTHLRELLGCGYRAVEQGDIEAVVTANADLHRRITELSGNAVLAELAERVARRVRWYHTSVAAQRGRRAWDEHAAIIEAIAERDAVEAARLMHEHTERTRHTYRAQHGTGEGGTGAQPR
ncbi:GntR family transcriptional regulator [Lipingzhangella sp. LS1_29]|uniref:GntR family transcriptional regulator n=1 Tax=Lipingzhangella rawalii TaxID=2055835 RepID=A0ABU2H2T5_9ACTN|nr:GntR family transcriptional regulator [Lipingzhangella rawalii]MDS1269601.1 GntR family transcriptional regulator [Lipingzhangella rawalii]